MLEQEAGELLEIEQAEGGIRTESVLLRAEDPNSALHKHFQWDDGLAGREYRLNQARRLIGKIKITVKTRKTNAFYNVSVEVDDKKVSLYHSYEVVAKSKNLTEQVLEQAVKEQKYWRNKYKDLTECMSIFDAEAWNELLSKVNDE